MHVVNLRSICKKARRGFCVVVCCGVLFTAVPAFASSLSSPPDGIDSHWMADLEQRALAANPKDQAFLYADLLDKMTVLASRQIAEGEIENAAATLARMEACTEKMENGLKQSNSLKKTELMLHNTNRHLSDLARAASADVKPQVQSALKRLNVAQTSLLVAIFEK